MGVELDTNLASNSGVFQSQNFGRETLVAPMLGVFWVLCENGFSTSVNSFTSEHLHLRYENGFTSAKLVGHDHWGDANS